MLLLLCTQHCSAPAAVSHTSSNDGCVPLTACEVGLMCVHCCRLSPAAQVCAVPQLASWLQPPAHSVPCRCSTGGHTQGPQLHMCWVWLCDCQVDFCCLLQHLLTAARLLLCSPAAGGVVPSQGGQYARALGGNSGVVVVGMGENLLRLGPVTSPNSQGAHCSWLPCCCMQRLLLCTTTADMLTDC